MKIKPTIKKALLFVLFLPLITGIWLPDSWAQPGVPSLQREPTAPDFPDPDFELKSESSQKQPPSSDNTSSTENDSPVNLTADRMLHLVEKDLVKAEGNVVVTYGARTISADEIIVNTETGKGQAKGNVVMTAEQGTRFEAEKAQFNMKAEKGRLFKVAGTLGDLYHITGEEVTKLSENHYTAQDATLTTCTGEIPDWQIDVADADVILDDRAWFAGGVFRIKNIPILYIPVGYVPILTKRKSGFLTPKFSTSSVEGETIGMTYFWAINQWADATLGVDYIERRGVRSQTEFRFAPSATTYSQVNFVFLDDSLTQNTFWKLDAVHRQHLPLGFKLNAKIDQTSKDNFNSVFRNQTELRTRRSSDSYASLFRKWDNHSFDVLTRYRESEQFTFDETFGILPTVTYKTQLLETGLLNSYFDQEASYTHFLFDVDPSGTSDLTETTQRFDFHPSLTVPINIAPWLQLTSRVGFRETFYNNEIMVNPVVPVTVTEGDSFSREMLDINISLEGPKFNRVFLSDDPEGSSFKHVIEPRFQYDYIPDMDRTDRARIRLTDNIDAIENTNQLGFFLVQRLLRKSGGKSSEVEQIARLEISQSYDLDEARGQVMIPGSDRRPFAPIRFDLDSQLSDNFFLNTDFTFNFYTDSLETWNIDTGIKLNKWLMLIFERRERDDQTASILGTLDISLPNGWNGKYSVRFDEFNNTLLEHNARLTYNDKCMCWGFTIDFIDRSIFDGISRVNETRILFGISLRGLGNFDESRGESFIHRTF